jgi:hypothetical protein
MRRATPGEKMQVGTCVPGRLRGSTSGDDFEIDSAVSGSIFHRIPAIKNFLICLLRRDFWICCRGCAPENQVVQEHNTDGQTTG